MVSFPCSTFCPEVPAIYHCVITGTTSRWRVSGGGVTNGEVTYLSAEAIGLIKSVSNSFTANKTGSNSLSLNFTAEIEYNNNVTVECLDLDNNTVNGRQCTITLEGKNNTLANNIVIIDRQVLPLPVLVHCLILLLVLHQLLSPGHHLQNNVLIIIVLLSLTRTQTNK